MASSSRQRSGSSPIWNDEAGAVVGGAMAEADTMMLGRVTYEEFAAHWQGRGSTDEMADYMNNTPKLVASNTLQSANWQNSTLIGGDVVQEIRRLKEQPGKNISSTGSATLVRSL